MPHTWLLLQSMALQQNYKLFPKLLHVCEFRANRWFNIMTQMRRVLTTGVSWYPPCRKHMTEHHFMEYTEEVRAPNSYIMALFKHLFKLLLTPRRVECFDLAFLFYSKVEFGSLLHLQEELGGGKRRHWNKGYGSALLLHFFMSHRTLNGPCCDQASPQNVTDFPTRYLGQLKILFQLGKKIGCWVDIYFHWDRHLYFIQ